MAAGGCPPSVRLIVSEMDLARRYGGGGKRRVKLKSHGFHGVGIALYPESLLIIKLPDYRLLWIMSRSLFLAMVLITLPSIGSILRGSSNVVDDAVVYTDEGDFTMLPILFRDLADEGVLKKGQKGLIVSSGYGDLVDDLDLEFLNDNEVEWVIGSDSGPPNSIPDESFDFAIGSSARNTKFIDRILKPGGIMIIPLSNDPSDELLQPRNYGIVYLRRFESTMVAMRKHGLAADGVANSRKKQIICGTTPETKKAALKHLEDALLEPPRKALAKSSMRKMKFLPDLMGDSLQNYPRRVFISDDKNGAEKWFRDNYPPAAYNQEFDFYNIDVKVEDSEETKTGEGSLGLSNWLRNTVKDADYVVMKAEAEVVEEMVRERTICLVDELFLECKSQWEENEGGEENQSQRAYWQCLELHGRLREEGVAVHQWWS